MRQDVTTEELENAYGMLTDRQANPKDVKNYVTRKKQPSQIGDKKMLGPIKPVYDPDIKPAEKLQRFSG